MYQVIMQPNSIPLELGFIVSAPEEAVVPLDSNASYSCAAIGNVFWRINDREVTGLSAVSDLAEFGIFAPLSTPNNSMVIITATLANNDSISVQCRVEQEGTIDVLNRTEIVGLLVYGESIPIIMSYSQVLGCCIIKVIKIVAWYLQLNPHLQLTLLWVSLFKVWRCFFHGCLDFLSREKM